MHRWKTIRATDFRVKLSLLQFFLLFLLYCYWVTSFQRWNQKNKHKNIAISHPLTQYNQTLKCIVHAFHFAASSENVLNVFGIINERYENSNVYNASEKSKFVMQSSVDP